MIEQIIQSPESRSQYLYSCRTPLRDEDMEIRVYGLDELEKIKATNKEKYGNLPLEVPTWNAGVLHHRGFPKDLSNLEFQVSSTFHSQAIRMRLTENEEKDDLPVTMIGIVNVENKYILGGVRRGKIQGNKISVNPFGYQDHDKRPLGQFLGEGIEESAIPPDRYSSIRVIGAQYDPDFTNGLVIVVYAQTTLTREEITQRHGEALTIYQTAQKKILAQGGDAYKARKEAKAAVEHHYTQRGELAPIDAGDHNPLLFFNREDVDSLIETNWLLVDDPTVGKRVSYPVMGPTKGALVIYRNCEERGVL